MIRMVNVYPQASAHDINEISSVPTSPYVKNYSLERKKRLVSLLSKEKAVKLLKFHQSLCPGCVVEKEFSKMLIDSLTYVKDNKVWIIKRCKEHGTFTEVSWSDFDIYKKAERFQDPGIKIENPHIEKNELDIKCPLDCGLCAAHESHTGLGNIAVTNRCDLSCWYCFFYAKANDPIYEPTLGQIKEMLKSMRIVKPVPANSVQFTGGEPTLREDIVEIVKAAHELGYEHIQLNTNGINLARDPDLAVQLRKAGVSNLYMSFDGVTAATNPKNYWEAPTAIDNCHKAGIGVVLVPTIIGGINDHELGDIVRFASGNIHAVRSVNFQPVSLVGRMPDKLRKKQRITIPSVIKRLEEQTNNEITRDDFFPVPCAKSITDFIEAAKQRQSYRLSVHFQCGMATYVFKDGERLIPLPRFFDVEGFFEYLDSLTKEINESKLRKARTYWSVLKLMKKINTFVDEKKKPKNLKFSKILASAVGGGDYKGLIEFHMKSLFIGMMHFQDPYNWDIDRIHKCDIHYAMPDGRVVPFCTFNVIPELYRDAVQRKFSISPREWEKRTGKRLASDVYRRNYTKEQLKKINERYEKFRRPLKSTTEPDWGKDALHDDTKKK